MYLSKLDVINDMLAGLGEDPLSSIEDDHESLAAGLRMLRTASWREQAKSWWYNREIVRVTPDALSGYIYLPDDCIRVDPQDVGSHYVQRGRRLYKPYDTTGNKYVFTSAVDCWFIRYLEFEDLPAVAQTVVSYAAQIDFFKTYEADDTKMKMAMGMYAEGLKTLGAEHIRNSNINLLERQSVLGAFNSIGRSSLRLPIIRQE